jgi:hypothetical protein
MADPVSIQNGSAAQGQSVPPALSAATPGTAGKAGSIGGFAALLSGLFQAAALPETQPLAATMLPGPPEAHSDKLAALAAIIPTVLGNEMPLVAEPPGPGIALPAAKASDAAAETHVKTAKASARDEHSVPFAAISGPDANLTVLDIAARAPPSPSTIMAMVPPALIVSDANPHAGKHDDLQKDVQLHRLGPSGSQDEQPAGLDFLGKGVLPAALPPREVGPEGAVVRSDAVPNMAVFTARSDIAQVLPSIIGASPLFQDIAPSHTDQAAPVGQIAPVLIGILKATDGTPSVTIHLRPPELGQVNIRVDQTAGGAARIGITVERPETLLLLQRDEPRLQQALDQAGILSTGRTLSFQVAPDQVGATASRPDSMAPGSGGSGQGQSGGAWRQNNDAQRNFGQDPDPDQRQAHAHWFRSGLDITA